MSRTTSSNSAAVSCAGPDRLEPLEHLCAAVLGVGARTSRAARPAAPRARRHRRAAQHDVVHARGPRRRRRRSRAETCRDSRCRGCARSATDPAARVPNQRVASSGRIAIAIVSNGRSPVNIRLSTSCCSVICRSCGEPVVADVLAPNGSRGSSSRSTSRRAAATPCS